METNNKTIARDLTEGSVTRILLAFSFPLLMANLLQMVYNMVDMIVIGQYVGPIGLSAVSIGGDVFHFLTFLAMGLSNAGQVIISQYIGAGLKDRLNGAIGTMFTVILGMAIVISVVCTIFLDPILSLMNTPDEALDYTIQYSATCIAGLFFIYGYNMISSILRGMGDSKRPFMFIAAAAVINLLLDLLFVAVFSWGPFGAALATVIGQAVSFIWAMIYLYRRKAAFGFDFKPKSFKPDMGFVPPLIKLGIPMCLQSAAIQLSMLFVNSYINSYGVIASAVTGIGNKLGNVTSVVCHSLSVSGASMIGQNIGAEKYSRVSRIIGISLIINMSFSLLLTAATVLFPDAVFGIFNSDEAVLTMAVTYVPVAVLNYIGGAIRSPLFALINGSGQPALNLTVGLLDGVFCRVGLALFFGLALQWGIEGFWYGNVIAGFVPFLIGGVYYLSGKWKKRNLI